MTQQLYLLRHAKAESWNPLGNDFSRSLIATGSQHSHLVANWAMRTLVPPDTILCSPAKRTRETLAPFLACWTRLLATTDYVDSMYNATLNMLLTLAEDAFTYSERLLMIGHNPGLEKMLIELLPPDQGTAIQHLEAGTLAVIDFSGGFKRDAHSGELLHLVRRSDFQDALLV